MSSESDLLAVNITPLIVIFPPVPRPASRVQHQQRRNPDGRGALITGDAAYSGVINDARYNRPANRSAFVPDSFGYDGLRSRFRPPDHGGRSVRFRFPAGTDTTVNDYG